MRDDRLRYRDVLQAIEQIRQEPTGSLEEFVRDRKQQVWVLFHLQIIGEALATLSPEQRQANESWARPIIATRNILVHHYFKVDVHIVWGIVKNRLDELEARVKGLLETLPEE